MHLNVDKRQVYPSIIQPPPSCLGQACVTFSHMKTYSKEKHDVRARGTALVCLTAAYIA